MSLFLANLKLLQNNSRITQLFSKLKVNTIGELLYFFPRSYKDLTRTIKTTELFEDVPIAVKATVCSYIVKTKSSSNRISYKFKVCDSSGVIINITFFNNPSIFKFFSLGKSFIFFGKIKRIFKSFSMICPDYFDEKILKKTPIIPIYNQVKGLKSKKIQELTNKALNLISNNIREQIPPSVQKKFNLCTLDFAIKNIHFPKTKKDIFISRKYFAFEQTLIFQLKLIRSQISKSCKNNFVLKNDFTSELIKNLPYELTLAQKRCIRECTDEMRQSSFSMKRLLQGDVGSGKTVVTAVLCYNTYKNGFQSSLMVPTEVLAKQHLNSFNNFFKNRDIKIELLTGSTKSKEKKMILSKLKDGKVDILIGTHALISDDIIFKNLAFVAIDEQHRFGISQREALLNKSKSPHALVISATPIPRTLAMIFYTDLKISIIDEMPPNRKKTKTFLVNYKKEEEIFNFICKLISKKQQGYIVCPLIEDSECEDDRISLEECAKKIKKTSLRNCKIEVLSGRTKESEKNKIASDFLSRKIDLLISTTVLEVGIDAPFATFMVIQNAERFGLSTLHQLRGRVGRSDLKSYCFLFSNSKNKDSLKRLLTLKNNFDGFRLAEQDLKTRGPGQFWGVRQHGFSAVESTILRQDAKTLEAIKKAAQSIIYQDPELMKHENRLLKKRLQFF
ncbi:MAG: ATP-dependent DNA helicase RecG [Oscillospiraceae bacterium]|jgi:ATP-dependent DNA helicase RecG|nr:ATP-dependent DNA helicase RecG [Oscillospiraceae bacterium]